MQAERLFHDLDACRPDYQFLRIRGDLWSVGRWTTYRVLRFVIPNFSKNEVIMLGVKRTERILPTGTALTIVGEVLRENKELQNDSPVLGAAAARQARDAEGRSLKVYL
ncbi:hypothetical protein B296_00014484 [Ensete ventricosum]|uniref:RING-type E3 ubiquitin transferase n=1 Tax=Ensete ventricosum TaxID=4639 RepID=A0A426YV16_ENSVE|nr:hypothetical protein B296_00014484 [Ensete ventricosum]